MKSPGNFKLKRLSGWWLGLSPILFNCELEKILRTWKKELTGIKNNIRIGAKKEKILVGCLAFADDVAIITENEDIARRYLEKLQEYLAKSGLQISFEEKEYMSKHQNNQSKL